MVDMCEHCLSEVSTSSVMKLERKTSINKMQGENRFDSQQCLRGGVWGDWNLEVENEASSMGFTCIQGLARRKLVWLNQTSYVKH